MLCFVEKSKSRGRNFCVFFRFFFSSSFLVFLENLIASLPSNFRLLLCPVDNDEESRKTCLYFERVTQIFIVRHVKCFVVICLLNIVLHYINQLLQLLPQIQLNSRNFKNFKSYFEAIDHCINCEARTLVMQRCMNTVFISCWKFFQVHEGPLEDHFDPLSCWRKITFACVDVAWKPTFLLIASSRSIRAAVEME